MAQFFGVLYWVGMIGMSLALVVTTVLIFALGFKFLKDRRKGLGTCCIAFSILAAAMLVMMVNKTFIVPGLS
ncbi:hypothetical protein ACTHSJ_20040 [Paenibacillus cellulositrophicus]|uniref:hypothetical protein n=1 Tax=Paenibacillus TaxID=44249 RepID=UPI000E254CD4|nr:hypothetical protein [Paenibacillus sp. VMFN-D1]MCM3001813.1 hypothetical protein [Paenibacillus cellulositrophicus]RED31571.1 hypothetical protein C7820_6009 [Paenibacillus sp. VMFN-D1]